MFSLFLIVLIKFFYKAEGQVRKIELLNADVSEFDQSVNSRATRLIGNVMFKHENAVMRCDSAYLYRDENRMEAYNNVHISQGDSMTLTGNKLIYSGNTSTAQVYENVVLSNRTMKLFTTQLDYRMNDETAYYTQGARIVDGNNTLTSDLGYFYSASNDFYFRNNVQLVNPRYNMTCDTLRYNAGSKIAYFLGPTWIISKENKIYCENGWYDTEKQISSFSKNSFLQAGKQVLKGDSVFYDRNKGIGYIFNNVSIYDSSAKMMINGNYGEHHELSDSSWVTGRSLLSNFFEKDTLFIHADTLLAVGIKNPSDTSRKQHNMFAFHGVKMYKPDLQADCDSLVYLRSDSTIRLFTDPVMWSGLNQLKADSITIETQSGEIRKIHMNQNAFISSRADTLQNGPVDSLSFNQIRGKNMTGYFSDNKMNKIDVNGNGQAIYYAKDKNDKNFAVNRAECSDMIIRVQENKVNEIVLIKLPEGTLYPINELRPGELRLKGFQWEDARRPASLEDIFRKNK